MTAVARALALVQPCPRICPELGTGGVGPHGATKYHFDAANPSTTKLPPYYDGAVLFGEFTRDYLKEIRLIPPARSRRSTRSSTAGPSDRSRSRSSATTRWTCRSGPTGTSTC